MATQRRDDGYEAAEHLSRTHDCPEHRKALLVNRWNRERQHYEAACPVCGRLEGFIKRRSTTQLWRENPDSVPVQIANRLANKHRDEIEAAIEGLPPELADVVRERYFGLPINKQEEEDANPRTD